MSVKLIKIIKEIALILSIYFFIGCGDNTKIDSKDLPIDHPDDQPGKTSDNFELSYWIDMDLTGNHLRGYWNDVTARDPDPITPESYISNACKNLKNTYGADKLYVIYHRQYEIAEAKQVFDLWKRHGKANNIEIVPTVVLQCYSLTSSMNFTGDEINNLARWSIGNINNDAFGIYDVYTRDRSGSPQDQQLTFLKEVIGNKLVMVGMQPGVTVNANYAYVVQDTWSAECHGKTNELWENPVYYKGTNIWGRKLLENWVDERISDKTRTVWNLIPVAWDYETNDPLGYDFPGDDQYKNDAPIPGRLELCQKYITNCYENRLSNPLHGGFSCDLHILEGNSGGRGEDPSFYKALRTNVKYTGDFSGTMLEIGSIYKTIAAQKDKRQ